MVQCTCAECVCVMYQNEDKTPVSSPTLSSPPFGLKPRSGENSVVLLTHMVPMRWLAWMALHFRGWCTFWALSLLSAHLSYKRSKCLCIKIFFPVANTCYPVKLITVMQHYSQAFYAYIYCCLLLLSWLWGLNCIWFRK